MTGKERIERILKHQPVDRIGLFEHFWNDTYKEWEAQGYLNGEDFTSHFQFDMMESWPFNLVANLDFEPEVVSETEETITLRDGNGCGSEAP